MSVQHTEIVNPPSSATRLTDIELHKKVWQLAWPSVTMMLLQTANGLMDTFFVGHLPNSADALAATGTAGGIVFFLISLAMGISVGTAALVSRFTGAKDTESAIRATGQSLSLGVVVGTIAGIIVYYYRLNMVSLMLDVHKNAAAVELCSDFLGIVLLAAVPLFIQAILMSAFRAVGDTRTPLLLSIASIATHISGNFLLIYGNFGFPRLGVRGAGIALALSILVSAIFYLVMLLKTPLAASIQKQHLVLEKEWVVRILKIGIPAAFQAVIRNLGMMTFGALLAHTIEGKVGVAAMQIGLRAEAIAFMPGFAYHMAASTLVGQSLGAKDPEQAERCGWAANTQAMIVMAFMAVIFYVLAEPFARAFTNDAHVQSLVISYLKISAIFEPFLAMGIVLTGALSGAGETLRPTLITLLSMWLVRLPLGWFLMFYLHWEAVGAWYALSWTTVLGGVLSWLLFRSGNWKKIKV